MRNGAALTWAYFGSAALQARWSPIVHVAILMPTCQRPRPDKSIRNQAEDLHIDALYRRSGVPRDQSIRAGANKCHAKHTDALGVNP